MQRIPRNAPNMYCINYDLKSCARGSCGRIFFLYEKSYRLRAVERSSNLRAFLRPVIGFGVQAQSTRNSQTSSHFDGVFAGASTGASGRWKMSDKTNGSIFGDGSILAIRRCRETNGLVDVYLLRCATSIVECSRNRASRIHTSKAATAENAAGERWDKRDRKRCSQGTRLRSVMRGALRWKSPVKFSPENGRKTWERSDAFARYFEVKSYLSHRDLIIERFYLNIITAKFLQHANNVM